MAFFGDGSSLKIEIVSRVNKVCKAEKITIYNLLYFNNKTSVIVILFVK